MEELGITDLDIQALVDGELSWDNVQRVRNYLATNPVAWQRYQELLEQKRLIGEWWSAQKSQRN